MKKIRLVVAAALVSTAGVAFAGDMYVAGSIGQSDFGTIDGTVAASSATSYDQHGTAFKLQLGYQFNPNWAVEGGYINLGKSTYNGIGNLGIEVKASGWNIGAVGTIPLNENFSLFGKIGMIDGKLEVNVNIPGASGTGTATKWKPTYGFGVKYDVSKTLGILAEYEHFDKLGDANNTIATQSVNLLSAGVMAKF